MMPCHRQLRLGTAWRARRYTAGEGFVEHDEHEHPNEQNKAARFRFAPMPMAESPQ